MRIKPVTNEIYHVYNRGVEKRTVFMEEIDYVRFIHDLYEFNNVYPAKYIKVGLPLPDKRELLVEILAFCLMPNHFHLMLKEKKEHGITEFMRKLGTGYTNYFNGKYERVGPLFQGKYKIIHINKDSYFLYLPYYIHLNPLEINFQDWREKKIDLQRAIEFLKKYRWSSFLDYIGIKNFPSVIQKDFLLEICGGEDNFQKMNLKYLKDWDINYMKKCFLE